MIGRLLDGPDVALHLGDRVAVAFEDLAAGRLGPRVRAGASDVSERAVHGARPGRDRRLRAEPGAAPRRPQPLGCRSRSTPRTRAIADAGLDVAQIDGFTTGALFPTAGAHTIQDGVSIVTANWLAEHLGDQPALRVGLPGLRADPRRGGAWR